MREVVERKLKSISVTPETYKKLKVLSALTGRKIVDLSDEAFYDLFRKYENVFTRIEEIKKKGGREK